MGFFSNLFGGGNVSLDENIPIQSVTIDRKKRLQQAKGKENVNNQGKKKKKGWGRNKKKKKQARQREAPQPAPKLSVFLQQIEPQDDNSLNQTVDTGSLTASITTNSISKSGSTSRPQTPVYARPLAAPEYKRPASAAGVSPPPLHESFPLDNVSENISSNSIPEASENLKPLPQNPLSEKNTTQYITDTTASLESSDVSSSDSGSANEETENVDVRTAIPQTHTTEDGSIAENHSFVGSEDAVEDISGTYNEDEANADFGLMLDDSSLTDVAELLSPLQIEFDLKTIEQDYLSAANSEHALENFSITSDSANEDLQAQLYLDMDNEELSFPVQMVFDCDFFKQNSEEVIQELQRKGEKSIENEVQKSFDEIVNEVEETIANAQSASHQNGPSDGPWIANGLLSSLRDDSSHSSSQNSQNSSFSFTSDDFKEEEFEEEVNAPVKAGLGITTIMEDEKEDDCTRDSTSFEATIEEAPEEDPAEKDPAEKDQYESRRSNCNEDQVKELRHVISQMMEKPPTSPTSPTSTLQSSADSELSDSSPSVVTSTTVPSTTTAPSDTAKSLSLSLNNSIPSSASSPSLNGTIPASSSSQSLNKNVCPPKSALLSKCLPRPELKKTVSWKDETDVYTYLPQGVEELQKARDLVATYEKIMAALNAKRPSSVECKGDEEGSASSSSDADLSERSTSSVSSIESLLSALSHASSTSSGSVKIVIDQIKMETERIVAESLEDLEEETEQARSQILENKWPEIVETNTSSSSIESLLSALSQASSNSGESMKMVVQKLKDEAERRVILSAQMESEIKEVLAKKTEKKSNDDDTSASSSTFSSLAQSDISKASSTGTSASVKELMKQLKNERSKQANVFKSQQDMFSLLHNDSQKEEARVQILDNDWVDPIDCGSSSSLSSLLSASPCSSTTTNDSSESVQRMMRTLKNEKERHTQRRERIRGIKEFVESACCIRTSSSEHFSDVKTESFWGDY